MNSEGKSILCTRLPKYPKCCRDSVVDLTESELATIEMRNELSLLNAYHGLET